MLIGYVSDERHAAIADVAIELRGAQGVATARSLPSGAIHAEVPDGPCTVILQKTGFGAKTVAVTLRADRPHLFRLLSDTPLGYAWPKWVRAGESAEFRLHAPDAVWMELWRYGIDKVKVRDLGWFDEYGPRAMAQILPDGDFTQTGAQWNRTGFGNPMYRQQAVAPERSGLYYFHGRTTSGRFFSFPWIVAPAAPTAPIAVLASNITWNAYNVFGGRNNYTNPDGLPAVPIVNVRQDGRRYTDPDHVTYGADAYPPLSFDRPEPDNAIPEHARPGDPIHSRYACGGAPNEWRLLAWLEREGFAYDLHAETQLDAGLVDLDRYRVLVINCHPEYWTRRMYETVKSWVHERGGKLAYLGGNGINCEVELAGDAMVCLNGNQRRRPTPAPIESRFELTVENEASLLGVAFTHAGVMTAAPYRVLDAGHWAFAGTGLSDGDVFGAASLHSRTPGGASAHETDKLTPQSPPGTRVLAEGLNPDAGGAQMATYETASGGAVFAAASLAWPSAVLVDAHVSQITRNVLSRFLGAG